MAQGASAFAGGYCGTSGTSAFVPVDRDYGETRGARKTRMIRIF